VLIAKKEEINRMVFKNLLRRISSSYIYLTELRKGMSKIFEWEKIAN